MIPSEIKHNQNAHATASRILPAAGNALSKDLNKRANPRPIPLCGDMALAFWAGPSPRLYAAAPAAAKTDDRICDRSGGERAQAGPSSQKHKRNNGPTLLKLAVTLAVATAWSPRCSRTSFTRRSHGQTRCESAPAPRVTARQPDTLLSFAIDLINALNSS